ncbi:MAG: sel1 repeat family protein, partial [Candidatus Methanomethylophilaceae archaeon]|nr:sel1 repeat family protein [Candidatus Methanomethylophilaceae archaeon]
MRGNTWNSDVILSVTAIDTSMNAILSGDQTPAERAELIVRERIAGSYPEAFTFFSDDREIEESRRRFFLGVMYYYGMGTRKDPEKAFELLKSSYDMGDGNAAFYLGMMYSKGSGVARTEYLAEKYLKEAASRGDTRAELETGILYLKREDGENAFKWIKKAADKELPEAQFILAQLYFHGFGCGRDEFMSLVMLKQAALHGHKGAQRFLADLYRSGGREIKKDRKLAKYWYSESEKRREGFRPLRFHLRPVILPSGRRSILIAAGTFGRPGIRVMVPQTGTMNPAPADSH